MQTHFYIVKTSVNRINNDATAKNSSLFESCYSKLQLRERTSLYFSSFSPSVSVLRWSENND